MLERFKVRATSLGARVRVLLAGLQGVSDDEQADDAEVVFPHGFASRPAVTATLHALALRVGDELLALALRDKGGAPFSPPLQAGETRVYNLGGATVRLLGAEIVFNGGTLKVARVSDPVLVGNLTVGGVGGVVLTFTPVDANGTPGTPIGPNATVQLSAVIANSGGATNVKA